MGAAALAAAFLASLAAAAPSIKQGYDMYRQAIAEKPLAQAVAEVRSQPGYTALDDFPISM